MKRKSNIVTLFAVSALTFAFLAPGTDAQADFIVKRSYRRYKNHKHHNRNFCRKRYCNHSHGDDHYPESHGKFVFRLPNGSITIVIGGEKYHYYQGYFYRKEHRGYVTVSAPIGAEVRRLPFGYSRVHIGRKAYFKYNGIYYQRARGGYVVVEDPTYHQKGFSRCCT